MNPLSILQDMQQKIESMLQNSPAKDVQAHIKSLMNNTFSKLDLVTREEFEVQKQVLQYTRAKLDLIEKQLDELLSTSNPLNISTTTANLMPNIDNTNTNLITNKNVNESSILGINDLHDNVSLQR